MENTGEESRFSSERNFTVDVLGKEIVIIS
jgi:hypothetical protein